MREIKFRMLEQWDDAWRWQTFTLPKDLGMDNEIYLNSERYRLDTLGQFSGLKDKNGEEIWEGDIIKMLDYGGSTKYAKVIYSRASFVLEDMERNDNYSIVMQDSYQMEIIGNIYENPELLTSI